MPGGLIATKINKKLKSEDQIKQSKTKYNPSTGSKPSKLKKGNLKIRKSGKMII